MQSKLLGQYSESLARTYLELKGFSFIQNNFQTTEGEIDLIMKDDEFIVFIEVKSIRNNLYFNIYETLTKRKKQRLSKAINTWLYNNNKIGYIWRVDFIGIMYSEKDNNIEHIEFIEL